MKTIEYRGWKIEMLYTFNVESNKSPYVSINASYNGQVKFDDALYGIENISEDLISKFLSAKVTGMKSRIDRREDYKIAVPNIIDSIITTEMSALNVHKD